MSESSKHVFSPYPFTQYEGAVLPITILVNYRACYLNTCIQFENFGLGEHTSRAVVCHTPSTG